MEITCCRWLGCPAGDRPRQSPPRSLIRAPRGLDGLKPKYGKTTTLVAVIADSRTIRMGSLRARKAVRKVVEYVGKSCGQGLRHTSAAAPPTSPAFLPGRSRVEAGRAISGKNDNFGFFNRVKDPDTNDPALAAVALLVSEPRVCATCRKGPRRVGRQRSRVRAASAT